MKPDWESENPSLLASKGYQNVVYLSALRNRTKESK